MTGPDGGTSRKLAALYLSAFVIVAAATGGFSHGLLSDEETLTATLSVSENVEQSGNTPADPGTGNVPTTTGPTNTPGNTGTAAAGNVPGSLDGTGVPIHAGGDGGQSAQARVLDQHRRRRRSDSRRNEPSTNEPHLTNESHPPKAGEEP